jgi:hypothetical protein
MLFVAVILEPIHCYYEGNLGERINFLDISLGVWMISRNVCCLCLLEQKGHIYSHKVLLFANQFDIWDPSLFSVQYNRWMGTANIKGEHAGQKP